MASQSHHKSFQQSQQSSMSITKNQIIHKYKESQRQKSILKNKLNILKKQYQSNNKRAKTIISQIKKINRIKESYKKNKQQIQNLLRRNKVKDEQKIYDVKLRKEQSKGKLPFIRTMLERQRSYEYLSLKKQTQQNQLKLRQYRNSVISQRRKTAHKIKSQQQMVSFNRTLYMQLRSKNVRVHQQEQAIRIQKKFKKSRQQLEQMRRLQDDLLQKLNKSRTNLNMSMTKMMKKGIRG